MLIASYENEIIVFISVLYSETKLLIKEIKIQNIIIFYVFITYKLTGAIFWMGGLNIGYLIQIFITFKKKKKKNKKGDYFKYYLK